MALSSGAVVTRCVSIQSRRHNAPDVSSTSSPSSSCRPSAVPWYRRVISATKLGARLSALSAVAAHVTTVPASAISFFKNGVDRGVVVATICGCSPRRSANCSMSQVRCGWRHLATSSHHAASNCGPRRLSGSSAENTWAIAPDGQIICPFDGSKRGRSLA